MKIVIAGNGRMGRAIAHLLGQASSTVSAQIELRGFDDSLEDLDADLLVGALPGGLGRRTLEAAIRTGTDLIDLTDLDQVNYIKEKERIQSAGVRVLAGCGFSPGLVNFITGFELARARQPLQIEILAGSLSEAPHHFPFLWCFEDLVNEFEEDTFQWIDGRIVQYPPLFGYRTYELFGQPVEDCYCANGFENIYENPALAELTYRVFNPEGFVQFFRHLKAHGLLDTRNLEVTKALLEARNHANLTGGQVRIKQGDEDRIWQMSVRAQANDELNSMQKLTGAFLCSIFVSAYMQGGLPPGLWLPEDLGARPGLAAAVFEFLRGSGIELKTPDGVLTRGAV